MIPKSGEPVFDLAFQRQWRNWTQPFLNEQDLRQELKPPAIDGITLRFVRPRRS